MAICRNTQTNDLYLYQGDNTYKNLRTGAVSVIPEDMAQKYLAVNIVAPQIINDFPLVAEMINRLNMCVDKI